MRLDVDQLARVVEALPRLAPEDVARLGARVAREVEAQLANGQRPTQRPLILRDTGRFL